MSPITKFWHCTLKSESTATNPAFRNLWSEILTLCSSYTNPASDPKAPPMHVVYQSTQHPKQLIMITGYQSQELNTECDTVYARDYLPRMFEFVDHVWLRQLDVDVVTLPLEGDRVVVVCGDERSKGKEVGGVGGWDVWQATRQAKENVNDEQGTRRGEHEKEKVWVQVLPGNETEELSKEEGVEEVFVLKKLIGR